MKAAHLCLDRAAGQALDEEAHGKDKEDQQRDGGDHITGEHGAILLQAGPLAAKADQLERDRPHVRVAQGNGRPNVIVPGVEQRQDGERAQDRFGHGHGNFLVDGELVGAIDAGGFEDLLGLRGDKAAQHKDGKGLAAGDIGQDQHPVGVEQAQIFDQQKERNQREHAGDHEQGNNGVEDEIAPRKAVAGEHVRRQRRQQHDAASADHADNDCVQQHRIELPPGIAIVLPIEWPGRPPKGAVELAVILERRKNGEEQRVKGAHAQDNEHDMQEKVMAQDF